MAVELKAIATLDGKPFELEITKIGGSVDKLGSGPLAGLKGMIAGAFSIGAVISFGRSMLQTADNMKQVGDATNLHMRSMVALKTVAAENNMDFDQMSKVLGKLRNAQGEVVSLSKPMLDSLQKLGITAEEFIGIPVDEVLEKIAKKFSESGGSADAFNAVTAIFGEKIGPKMMDMLRALADEGMVNLKKRTEEATKGFEKLAEAQGNIEKFKSGAELTTGKAVGGIMGLFEKLGEMVYGAGKFENILTEKITPEGYAKTQSRIASQAKPSIAKPVDPAMSADLAALAANQYKADVKAMDAALRADEKKFAKEDEFNRAQDQIAIDHEKKRQDLLAGKGIETPARARVDSLQAIGGLIGGVAGRGDQAARIAERQAKSAEAIETLMRETNSKLDDLNRKMDGIISE